jgi:hypothetical protein
MSDELESRGLGYSIRYGLAHAALIFATLALRFSCWCLAVPEVEERRQ